jgi:hypothetical protein
MVGSRARPTSARTTAFGYRNALQYAQELMPYPAELAAKFRQGRLQGIGPRRGGWVSIRDHPGVHVLYRKHVPDALSVRRGGRGRFHFNAHARGADLHRTAEHVRVLPPIAGLLAGPPLRRRKCGKLVAGRAPSASPRIGWENCGVAAIRPAPAGKAGVQRVDAPARSRSCRAIVAPLLPRLPEGLRKLGPCPTKDATAAIAKTVPDGPDRGQMAR